MRLGLSQPTRLPKLQRLPGTVDLNGSGRRGIVAIWQHCDMNASVCCRYNPASGSPSATLLPFAGMTSAETSAPSLDPTFAESKGGPLRRFLAPFAVGLALLSTFLTFVVLTGLTRIQPTPEVVISFLLINTATILLLVGIIIREVWQVVQARRRGRAAARLHVQIVSLFSVIAVLPAVLVSIVANITIDRGLDRLFSGPTREVIQNSLIVANAYLHEHAQLIRGDILGMANDLAHALSLIHISEPTRRTPISYAVFCLKKKK